MMFRCKLAFLHWMLFAPFLTTSFALAGEEEFYRLQQKLEEDVLELRSAAEEAYRNRCDVETLDRCFMGSFHGCYSSFPDPKCLSGEEFQYDVCGQPESSCGTLWDYSVSSIRFPPSFLYDAPDPEVIESMYFSQAMDEFFVTKTEIDKQYWESNYGISPPWMHFGAPSGAFRIFPARPQEDCPGDFDPRLRPWYVAGSSGPKNIILLLDNSGSMDGLRLAYLKEAALRVIDTLTIGDR